MKDGAIEQCDTPDKIVLDPQTPYVQKFTEEIEKSRVVHASVLAEPINGQALEGEALDGTRTIQQLARQLMNDTRDVLPVADKSGTVNGMLKRQDALDLLLGES